MRVVVAPDKFKGSLTAVEAAEAIGEGLRQGRPGVDVVLAPVAVGGDGTVDAADWLLTESDWVTEKS